MSKEEYNMQRTDFIEIYKEMIEDMDCSIIDHNIRILKGEKVPMDDKLVGPNDTFVVNELFGMRFNPDSEGMCEILQMLEDRYKDESERPTDLMNFLFMIYKIVDEYLGGFPTSIRDREESYFYIGHEGDLKLSDIKGKSLGACAEWSTIAHNCIVVLQKAGMMKNFSSKLTSSNIMVDGSEDKHTFILLKNNDDTKGSYIFDLTNPIIDTVDGRVHLGVFALSPEELEKFESGEPIIPLSVFEKAGMQIHSGTRIYCGGIKKISRILPADLIDASDDLINFTRQEEADNSKKGHENPAC